MDLTSERLRGHTKAQNRQHSYIIHDGEGVDWRSKRRGSFRRHKGGVWVHLAVELGLDKTALSAAGFYFILFYLLWIQIKSILRCGGHFYRVNPYNNSQSGKTRESWYEQQGYYLEAGVPDFWLMIKT